VISIIATPFLDDPTSMVPPGGCYGLRFLPIRKREDLY
jgi:hypothetical protein